MDARQITRNELKYGTVETKALFKDVLKEATERFRFNEEGLPLMIEAIPIKQDELMVILSAVEDADELDPHFACYREEEGVPEEAGQPAKKGLSLGSARVDHAVLRFDNIDSVVSFSKKIVLFPGESDLYRGTAEHEFFLILHRPAEMETAEFYGFLHQVAEDGELRADRGMLAARLMEHETSVLKNAHKHLAVGK